MRSRNKSGNESKLFSPRLSVATVSITPFSQQAKHLCPQKPLAVAIMSSASVQRPAPGFTATAVVAGGEFKEVSLSDYLGQWFVNPPPRR